MAYSKNALLANANVIKDANTENSNTATRIGQMFVDIINGFDEGMDSRNEALNRVILEMQHRIVVSETNIQDHENRLGALESLTDDSGKIQERFIPSLYDDVLEFGGFAYRGTIEPRNASRILGLPLPATNILFHTGKNMFCYRDMDDRGVLNPSYANNWDGGLNYGTASVGGHTPEQGKLYVNVSDNTVWRWSGGEMVKVGSSLELGYTSDTAFPGHAGQSLINSIERLEEYIAWDESNISELNARLTDVEMSKGERNGLAPLDADGKVPSVHLPNWVDDVIEFRGILSQNVSLESGICEKTYQHYLVFDPNRDRFLVCGLIPTSTGAPHEYYYASVENGDQYGTKTTDGYLPFSNKVYVDTETNITYRWSGTQLVVIGSDLALGSTSSTAFPGDKGQEAYDLARGVCIYPFVTIIENLAQQEEGGRRYPLLTIVYDKSAGGFKQLLGSGWETARMPYNSTISESGEIIVNSNAIFRLGNELYRYDRNAKDLVKVGGAAVGNTLNLTIDHKLAAGCFFQLTDKTKPYYAPQYVIDDKKQTLGLQITFPIGEGTWKTYQYIGTSIEDDNDVLNKDNWLDLAGMTAGSEPFINMDDLLPRTDGSYYTLERVIDGIETLKTSKGVDYAKPGLVVTWRKAENETVCYQFRGDDVAGFKNVGLWKEFGAGSVKVFDTPNEKGSTEAFSTKGAYALEQEMFAGLELDQDADYHIIRAKSKADTQIGDEIKIQKSTGGGVQTGSTLNIYPEYASLSGAYGSRIEGRYAIKSVSYDKDTEVYGTITRIEVYDNATGVFLYGENYSGASSASSLNATDYRFTIDFTSFFTGAAERRFDIVAYDDQNNKKTRQVQVTAVDVTCSFGATKLTYDAGKVLDEGAVNPKNITLYEFPYNVSREGIKAIIEMYWNGEWKALCVPPIIMDSFPHSVPINASNVFGGGEKLTHGSYMVRIQGEDVKSGVRGNTLYTTVMCVNPATKQSIVSIRYDDKNNGTIRLYDSLMVEVNAYTPGATEGTVADVVFDGNVILSQNFVTTDEKVSKQIQGYPADGSKTIEVYAKSGNIRTESIKVQVLGSAIAFAVKDGARFGYDFSTRTNNETDHTISDNGVAMTVVGSNWSSNGFSNYLGANCLRIAENVTVEIDYAPFGNTAIEGSTGMALQFCFATKNIKEDNAVLMDCLDTKGGTGFQIFGNRIEVTCAKGSPNKITRSFRCGEKITVAIVVEPSSRYTTRGEVKYSTIKLYVNGEEIGAIGYVSNSNSIFNSRKMTFDGTEGDFYLYYMLAYGDYYSWEQAFQNYLCKVSNTDDMIAEYEAENILDVRGLPSLESMKAKGMPYYVVVAPDETFAAFDSGISTSDLFACTLYYFNPQYPCLSFKAINTLWRRQGTTSAKRPIKNDRFNFNKKNKITGLKATVELLNPDDSTELGRKAIAAAKVNKVLVDPNGHAVDIITVKVDYSDSSNANDCGVCDMMNATFRALGNKYMTPAQRFFNGNQKVGEETLTGIQLDHSTKNHPIAAFRSTMDTLTDAWFHAKGNWKEDKGEQVALGFKDTPGYNLGCKNYGDFVEFFGNKGETLTQTIARFRAAGGLDTSKLYLISQYCGRDYRFMRYTDGAWNFSNGSMKYVGGRWVVSGDVLNPVCGYELLDYVGFCWWQGVSTVEEMMAPVTKQSSWVQKTGVVALGSTVPAWTQYFECMIDDDQLQQDLALGKKVPYDLFCVLQWCSTVNYASQSESVWKPKWRSEAWRYMNVHSLMAYYAFTDYLAAVDQQAKNMQPMFFMEEDCWVENGVYHSASDKEAVRMYFNKVYDCDTCNGKDNDGGNTIPATLDPEADFKAWEADPTAELKGYAGRGSILWNDLRGQKEMIVDASGAIAKLDLVVKEMRSLPALDGVGEGPFSAKGAIHYFLTMRAKRWAKVISSYDGEHKYINYSGYSDTYFYALQGLGLTSLPAFIEERWRMRDGYYQTGDFLALSHIVGGRIGAKVDAVIRFRAAKSGYFGIGNDGGSVSDGFWVNEGEEGVFGRGSFVHGDNVLLYIYNADLMSEIDLSQIQIDNTWQLSQFKLAEVIKVGCVGHSTTWRANIGNTDALGTANLGELPFLREIDIRETLLTTLDASECPRLEKVLAEDSKLTTISLAETSPIRTLHLPDTITELKLVNLPKLTYPGGMEVASMRNVSSLLLSGCPGIDPQTILREVMEESAIEKIRIPAINMTAPSYLLARLKDAGAIGLTADGAAIQETGKCSGLFGRWICEDLVSETDLAVLAAYFPQLELHNSQYSYVIFDDHTPDEKGEDIGECENITNPENKTGYQYKNDFEPSGHFLKIFENAHAYKCEWDDREKKLRAAQILDTDYTKMADGTSFDPTDASGIGFDLMLGFGKYWYKGVNDFKNQRKYFFGSYGLTEPLSTSTRINRKKCGEILRQANAAIMTTGLNRGDDYEITDNANMSCYEMDVQGMKQVRWPGVNSAVVGAVFVDEDDKVVSTFNMAVTHPLFDFTLGDYIFCDVPSGAVKFIFTAPNLNKGTAMDTPIYNTSELECIAVDSNAIEAIEPDWVDCRKLRFVGVYGMYIDALMKARSISGVKTRTGTGTQTTNPDWKYDKEGELTNATVPVSTMYYTYCDILNLCLMRGEGFHAISYEISKDLANLIMALTGTRDIQALCGRGCGSQYTTGSQTINGKNINLLGKRTEPNGNSGNGNLMFGIQNFVGCNWEVMEYICANVSTYRSFRANKRLGISGDPVNARYHIHDPYTNTERVVQGINASGYCIGRVRFGRFCDTIASRVTSDTSLWNKHYSDVQYYSHSTGRCVGRSYSSAIAYGGLVFSSANDASSDSYASVGSRLAFSGAYEIVE